MKFCLIFILFTFFTFAQKLDPFSIELRPRVIDDAKVIVNIEVTNHLNRPIDYLEGFLSEYSSKTKPDIRIALKISIFFSVLISNL